MLMNDYTLKILNLKDVIIKNVENVSDQLHIYIELPRKTHTCPVCGAKTDRIHDYRMQVIKDIPMSRNTFLHLRKRRYCCSQCNKRFFEDNHFLPRYYRMTSRLIVAIIHAFRKVVSATEISSRFNVSVSTAIRYFDCVNYHCKQLPEVLSIDEFKGNAGGQKYQSILTDPKNRRIIDILPDRYESHLIAYFKSYSDRENVRYFISDMNPHFKEVARICFPKAILVADKYHVVRQAVWAMERVRKAEQQKLSDRFRKYFKRSRGLLNKSTGKLSDEEIEKFDAEETFEEGPGELAIEYQSMSEMVNDADLIAEITVDELQVIYNEYNLPKTHTTVILNHVIRKENTVNVTKGQKITVIEEGGIDGFLQGGIPQMEKGTEYILFLQQYENNYYICGAFQGRFILKSGYAFQQGWESVKLKEYYPLQRLSFFELLNN